QRAVAWAGGWAGPFDRRGGRWVAAWALRGEGGGGRGGGELGRGRAPAGPGHLQLAGRNMTGAFDRGAGRRGRGRTGKGYALERAASLLGEHELPGALIHGGTSSVYGMGAPPGSEEGWKIGIRHPTRHEERIATVVLHNRALGVSAPHGKFFERGGERY